MEVWSADNIAINLYYFVLFFIPGFIIIKLKDLIFEVSERDFSKSVYDAIAYSAIHYAVFGYLVYLLVNSNLSQNNPFWFWIWAVFLVIILPAIWPTLFYISIKFHRASNIHFRKRPWEIIFHEKVCYWTIVTLKNGSRVGGKYDINSLAASNRDGNELYLEQVWKISETGQFLKPIDYSEGILILKDEISSIEFFGSKEANIDNLS